MLSSSVIAIWYLCRINPTKVVGMGLTTLRLMMRGEIATTKKHFTVLKVSAYVF